MSQQSTKQLALGTINGQTRSRRDLIKWGLASGLSFVTVSSLISGRSNLAQAVGGGTMRMSFAQDIQVLDPQLVQSDSDLLPSTLLYSRLTQWDATMLDPQPDVAESWSVSEDGKTYVFTLRPGVKFSSGREVTAEDVVFSYQRAIDTGERGRGLGELRDVESFEATGSLEFTVRLKQPSAVFLNSTGHWALPILNSESVADIDTKPDGTGPFTFVEWMPGDHVTYRKNPGYWNQEILAQWPDEIYSQPIVEAVTRIANLQSGQVDLISNVPSQLVATLEGDDNIQLIRQPFTASYFTLTFNLRTAPFDNVLVRRAVEMAIDKEAIHQNVFYNTGEIGCSLIPSGHWAYDETIQCQGRDVEGAKALLAEAGYPDGLQVSFKYGGNSADIEPPLAEILKQSLSEAGIELDLQLMEPAIWAQEVWLDKQFEMTAAWYTREPDPDGLMQSVLRTGGGNNVMGYSNAEIEQLFDEGKATLDQTARKEIYGEITRIMLEDMPLIKLQTVEVVWAGNHKISGLQVWPKGMPNYLDYTFDPDA